jgi:hypothetical protein
VPVNKMVLRLRKPPQRVPLTDQVGLAGVVLVAGILMGGAAIIVRHAPRGLGQELAIVVAIAFALAGLMLIGQAIPRGLIWTLEELFGTDINGDGQKGEPSERIVFVNKKPGAQVDLDETWQRFIMSRSHSESAWRSKLGEAVYDFWRDWLIISGMARWNNDAVHQQGWVLTDDPDDILHACPSAPLPPTLPGLGA